MALLLSHDDVRAAVTMSEAIEAMEHGFREEGEGGVTMPARTNIKAGKGWFRIGPVVMEHSGWMGFKAMNLCPGVGVRYQVHLYSVADGALKAIMDAQHLTTLRTGATSAVATRRLARGGPTTVAVLGSGAEAGAQLEAMHALGVARRATVYSRSPVNRERFARAFQQKLSIEVAPAASAREAIAGAGIVVAAVKSSEHVLFGKWLEPGTHVNSVGTARPDQREIDAEVFRRSDVIAVDTRQGVFGEAGDAIVAKDVVVPGEVHELSAIVIGAAPQRSSDAQITLFKSVGTSMQDIRLAAAIYDRARASGLGTTFADFPYVKKT